MASKLKVDELAGSAGNTISLASGQTLDTTSGTLTATFAKITIGDESSNTFDVGLGDEFSIIGGEGVDTTLTGNLLTIAGEDATASNKGVASFSSDNFAISSGAVSIKDDGIATAEIQDDAVTTAKIADNNITEALMADDAISSAELKSLVTIQILASDGTTVVKTIFTPGS